MKLIIDERERDIYNLLSDSGRIKPGNIQIQKEVLPLGDILIESDTGEKLVLIERKTCADLLASIKDGRYDEQSYRLIHSTEYPFTHNIIYLIEGVFHKYVWKDRKLMYSTMTSLGYFKGFSVLRTSTVDETADLLLAMTDKIDRDLKKGKLPAFRTATVEQPLIEASEYCSVVKKVKKENVTPENIGEIILCQIPSVSSVTAISIMKHFGTFPALMTALQQNPSVLDKVMCGGTDKKRKISKTCVKNIKQYLVGKI